LWKKGDQPGKGGSRRRVPVDQQRIPQKCTTHAFGVYVLKEANN